MCAISPFPLSPLFFPKHNCHRRGGKKSRPRLWPRHRTIPLGCRPSAVGRQCSKCEELPSVARSVVPNVTETAVSEAMSAKRTPPRPPPRAPSSSPSSKSTASLRSPTGSRGARRRRVSLHHYWRFRILWAKIPPFFEGLWKKVVF